MNAGDPVVTGAGLVTPPGIDETLEGRLSPHQARRLDRLSQMIVAAALLAAEQAGRGAAHGGKVAAGGGEIAARGGKVAVVVGTGLGCLQKTDEYLGGIVRGGVEHADALTFPDTVDNAPAAHVSVTLGCGGPSMTVTGHEISGECAVIVAALLLRRGLADAVVVAAGDAPSPRLHEALARLAPGVVAGEGAAALVLETAESAGRRGAAVVGRLLGYAQASEASPRPHLRFATPAVVTRAEEAALRMAGLGDGPAIDRLRLPAGAATGHPGARGDRRESFMADGVVRSVLALERLARHGAAAALVAQSARGGTAAALVFGRAGASSSGTSE